MPSALDYLGITPPGNPLSQFFPQQGGDNDFRSQLEERPMGRSAIPPELALATQLPDPSGFLQQVQQFRGQNEAKQAIQSLQNLDFGSKDYPASVAKLLSKYPNAAQNSAVQNILKLKSLSGQQSQQKQYDDQASKALKSLYGIRSDDPEYDQKLQALGQDLPDEVFQNPRFASTWERALHNADTVRSKRTVDQQANQMVDRELLKNGLKPSKFSSLEDKQDALAEMMQEGAQQKKVQEYFRDFKDEAKEYTSAMRGVRATPTDEEKIARAGKTKPSEMSHEDWVRTDALVRKDNYDRLQDVVDRIRLATGVHPFRAGSSQSGASEGGSGTVTPPLGSNAPQGVSVPSTALPAELLPEGAAGRLPAPQAAPEVFTPVGELPAQIPTTPPTGFSGLQQQVAQQQQRDAHAATEAATAKAKADQFNQQQLELKKNELLSKFRPEFANYGPSDYHFLAGALGVKPNEAAFRNADGKGVSWDTVISRLMADPQMEAIRQGKPILATAPVDPKTASLRAKYQY